MSNEHEFPPSEPFQIPSETEIRKGVAKELARQAAQNVTNQKKDMTDRMRGVTNDREEEEHEQYFEMVKNAELVALSIDSPESPILREIETIYTANLVPDMAFYYLLQGEQANFLEHLRRCGMLNQWAPLPGELSRYPRNYQTVRDKMTADMLGRSPGEYRVFGLRAGNGSLIAWISLRLPPRDARSQKSYATYIRRALEHVNFDMGWQTILKNQGYGTLVEIDTINARPDYRGAGTRMLLEGLKRLAEEQREHNPFFYYRFGELRLQGQQRVGAPNDASANLFHHFGCTDIGYREQSRECVVRTVPNVRRAVMAHPKWRYGYSASIENAIACGEHRWEQLVQKHSQLRS